MRGMDLAMTSVPSIKSVRRNVYSWIVSERGVPKFVRLSVCSGLVWAGVQFTDRFDLAKMPAGKIGILIFVLAASCLFFAVEYFILDMTRPNAEHENELRTPERAFADSILQYAHALAESTPPRDQSLLELRAWSSRLLHLTDNHQQRQELGQLALGAASAVCDRDTQVAILLDDLGWSVHEAGDSLTAVANIREGLALLDEEMTATATVDPSLIEMKCKGLRHIANIESAQKSLPEARAMLSEPRTLAASLPDTLRELNEAQVDHSEAQMILRYLDSQLGKAGQVDPTGENAHLLNEAEVLAQSAEQRFRNLRDIEREAKALKLTVQLLAHDTRKQRYQAAASRLRRLDTQVARNLR